MDQVRSYIALSNSEEVAASVIERIVASVERLATFPISGRSGRVIGTRELVVPRTPFVVAYAIVEERVVVLAVTTAPGNGLRRFEGREM